LASEWAARATLFRVVTGAQLARIPAHTAYGREMIYDVRVKNPDDGGVGRFEWRQIERLKVGDSIYRRMTTYFVRRISPAESESDRYDRVVEAEWRE
jgi:hypothetical protein